MKGIIGSAQPFLHHLLVQEWVESAIESAPSGLRSDKIAYISRLCERDEQEAAGVEELALEGPIFLS